MKSFLTRGNTTIILFTVFCSFLFMADQNGKTGRTMKSSSIGCDCHTKNTAVSVVIAGPATLAKGAKGTYTVTITGGPLKAAGTDIAVSAGTLALNSSETGLRLSGGELTHKSPKLPTSSKVVFTFDYTAPATGTTATIYAVGNSVNNTGTESGDGWNNAPNMVVSIGTTDVHEAGLSVSAFKVEQNYPNPFNPSTTINYYTGKAGNVLVKVYNLAGAEIETLVNGFQNAGQHKISFDAGNLMSGVYFYSIQSGSFKETRKMILTK